MRLTKRQGVTTLALPARAACELCKASLPGPVEFDEKLVADVPGNVSEPRQLGAEPGQFVDLVEGRQVALVVAAAREADAALLESQVPEKAKRRLPGVEAIDLLRRRVDAEPKSLHDTHRLLRHLEVGRLPGALPTLAGSNRCSTSHGSATRRQRVLPALKDGVSALEIG